MDVSVLCCWSQEANEYTELQCSKLTRLSFPALSPGERGQAGKCLLFSLTLYTIPQFSCQKPILTFFICVFLSTVLCIYLLSSSLISSLRIRNKANSIQNPSYVRNVHIGKCTEIYLEHSLCETSSYWTWDLKKEEGLIKMASKIYDRRIRIFFCTME